MLAIARLRRRDGHEVRPTACTIACRCTTPSAGCVATGAVLLNGGSVVIREKFSAREFWDDVVRDDCTLFQYIGELCRYLVHSPPNPNETKHQLRMACGNGLRPDLWDGVQDPLPHPAHPRILRRDRRQREHLQLRGQAGRGRARAVVRRAPLSDRGGALRRRDASSRCATRKASASAASRTNRAR